MTPQESRKIRRFPLTGAISPQAGHSSRPTRMEAEEAVRTLIAFIGDDPRREGLADTPRRVVEAFAEYYRGYGEDAAPLLTRTFSDVAGYDDMVMLRNIAIHSHCEHHMAPITGRAHIAYMPAGRVVGISKLARVVDIFARRLQTQETMTAEIAAAIQSGLQPHGVALMVRARHGCMTARGVHKPDADMVTTRFTGIFTDDANLRARFFAETRHADGDSANSTKD